MHEYLPNPPWYPTFCSLQPHNGRRACYRSNTKGDALLLEQKSHTPPCSPQGQLDDHLVDYGHRQPCMHLHLGACRGAWVCKKYLLRTLSPEFGHHVRAIACSSHSPLLAGPSALRAAHTGEGRPIKPDSLTLCPSPISFFVVPKTQRQPSELRLCVHSECLPSLVACSVAKPDFWACCFRA